MGHATKSVALRMVLRAGPDFIKIDDGRSIGCYVRLEDNFTPFGSHPGSTLFDTVSASLTKVFRVALR